MPFGVIAGLIVLVGFAMWGIVLMRSKAKERATERSSHYESNIGQSGSGDGD